MAQRKKAKRAATNEGREPGSVTAVDKIAGVLALIATKGMDTDDAALKLDAIGFASKEISDLLDVGPNYVNGARYRKNTGGKKARKKRAS